MFNIADIITKKEINNSQMANVTLRNIVKNIVNKSKPNNVSYRRRNLEKLFTVMELSKVERVDMYVPTNVYDGYSKRDVVNVADFSKAISFKLVNSKTLDVTFVYNSELFNYTGGNSSVDKVTFRLTFKGPTRANINKSNYGAHPLIAGNLNGNQLKKARMYRNGELDFSDYHWLE